MKFGTQLVHLISIKLKICSWRIYDEEKVIKKDLKETCIEGKVLVLIRLLIMLQQEH